MFRIEVINSLKDLMTHIEDSLDANLGPRWFRGAGDFEHGLIPSLLRHPSIAKGEIEPMELESRVLARFQQTSPHYLHSPPATHLDWLFLAQHFGVPTRLLDWSENPFIALYFALAGSSPGSDPCVWLFDPLQWTKMALTNPNLPRIPDPADRATTRFIESLSDDLAPSANPIAIYSNYTNPRIVAQRGTFTLFGKSLLPMERSPFARDCLTCLVISNDARNILFDKIMSIGYTHSVVYPDLSGLGSELKTTFGF